jgi:hypothetical protein
MLNDGSYMDGSLFKRELQPCSLAWYRGSQSQVHFQGKALPYELPPGDHPKVAINAEVVFVLVS